MEFFGLITFLFVLFNSGLPKKVKKLKKDVTKIKKLIKGESKMSEILKELEGKRCKIIAEGSFNGTIDCEVINVDDEWMKISQILRKEQRKIKIIRIDNIIDVSIA